MRHVSIAVILFLSAIGAANANPDLKFVGATNFEHQFPQATQISYKVKELFTEVNFIWNDMRLEAFYDFQGNLVATCRSVELNSLPVAAQLTLKDQYPGAVVRDAIEYNDPNDEVSYYVTMVGPKATYLLRVSTGGTFSGVK